MIKYCENNDFFFHILKKLKSILYISIKIILIKVVLTFIK